mgnify:CR=1 FL=1
MSTVNKDIRVVIIEDEPHNSMMLKGMVRQLRPHWKIEAILESVEESIAWLKKNPGPDLILMDIQLSDATCFSIFNEISLDPRSRIIFTTAYDEYAIRAFKVNSLDYLLKPIDENELNNAFIKFEEQRKLDPSNRYLFEDSEHYQEVIESILKGKTEYRTRFMISGVSEYKRLDTKSIAYIYSSNKLSLAVNRQGKEYILDYSLEELEKELNPKDFFRLNRKIIANIEAIEKIKNEKGGKLKVTTSPACDFEIILSRLRAPGFKKWMGK